MVMSRNLDRPIVKPGPVIGWLEFVLVEVTMPDVRVSVCSSCPADGGSFNVEDVSLDPAE
jgi:hypothetical protein